jgi:Uncharacterised nucleotidyltransferase
MAARRAIRRVGIDAGGDVAAAPTPAEALWSSVERLLSRGTVEGVRTHKLGALAGRFMRLRGEAVPRLFAADERAAVVSMVLARRVLELVRPACEGPLVLIKGPEIASLYPGHARVFADLDLLAEDPPAVQRSLIAAGFVETGEFYEDAHHLRALRWPGLGVTIEIHKRPSWPKRLAPPSLDEIFERAVVSSFAVDGVLVPHPEHHALIVAAHGWKENPLGTLRDLIDVAALSAGLSESALEELARAWGLTRVWDATVGSTRALLEDRPLGLPLRLWAGHLTSIRERTLLEGHLRGWLQGFWKLPPRLALLETRDAIRKELRPARGEGWRDKLWRTADAIRHPRQPHSRHDEWPRRAPQ